MKKYILIVSALVIVFSLGFAVTLTHNPNLGLTVVLAQSGEPSPDPSSTPINGTCSTTIYTCDTGTYLPIEGVPGWEGYDALAVDNHIWVCTGSDGGTGQFCSIPRSTPTPDPSSTPTPTPTPTPINGVCGITPLYTCSAGTYVQLEGMPGYDALTVIYNIWGCGGLDGGTNITCTVPRSSPTPTPTPTPTPINGSCGTSVNSCLTGSFQDLSDESANYRWWCTGSSGGATATCTLPILPDELMGWAWSSNIGWISFNSANSNSGGGNYRVVINKSTGALSGYAWSSNIGWISFNTSDVAGCPAGSCPPMVDLSTGAVTGWAKVLSDSSWIELSGTNHASPVSNGTGGVTLNTTTKVFSGSAWESNYMGWTNFNANSPTVPPVTRIDTTVASLTGSCAASPVGSNETGQARNVTFQATQTGIGTVAPYTYSWTGTTGTFSAPSSITSNYPNSASGPILAIKDNNGVTSANISCPYVTVDPPPAPGQLKLFIGATGATTGTKTEYTVTTGRKFGLKWANTLSTNVDTGYSDCEKVIEADSGTINGDWTGQWSQSVAPGSSANVNNLSAITPGTYNFRIVCKSNVDIYNSALFETATSKLKVRSAIEGEI